MLTCAEFAQVTGLDVETVRARARPDRAELPLLQTLTIGLDGEDVVEDRRGRRQYLSVEALLTIMADELHQQSAMSYRDAASIVTNAWSCVIDDQLAEITQQTARVYLGAVTYREHRSAETYRIHLAGTWPGIMSRINHELTRARAGSAPVAIVMTVFADATDAYCTLFDRAMRLGLSLDEIGPSFTRGAR